MTYRIGNGSGFSGDRVDAALPVVRQIHAHGRGGALIFETIGERTLALGHLARRSDPALGYDPLLADLVRPVLADCVRSGIVIVGNFGVANPRAAAALIADIARDQGLHDLRVAVVEGDDIRDGLDLSLLDRWEGDSNALDCASDIISANVYIGARQIAEAIRHGAQVVVTGRVADPSLALGPLVAHFDWSWDDWDLIAAGTLAGHLLECGSQVTGGYFADPGFKDVPDLANVGFPIAEVEADGSFVITKPEGTGGVVDLRTVKEQLLYEIHDPSDYLTPDVVLDITGVSLTQSGQDRVSVRGARGRPAPELLKATVGVSGDWLGEAEISYAGPNALARAQLAAAIVEERVAAKFPSLRRRFDFIGALSVFGGDNRAPDGFAWPAPADVRMRMAVSAREKAQAEYALREVAALYCTGPAGGGGIRSHLQARINTASFLAPRSMVKPRYQMTGGAT
ncbi:acyclic terpene utilization AtuA family protein [Mesorhizobium sp. CAU 1741]|uniref:acyclic terpene utilization AtuA family protein n=1 Tax=Mesorhizobium sp. CAU 1741 TaxID=3140366 RepID=UPI00325C170B